MDSLVFFLQYIHKTEECGFVSFAYTADPRVQFEVVNSDVNMTGQSQSSSYCLGCYWL